MRPDGSRGQAPEATGRPVRIGTGMGCLRADDDRCYARRGGEHRGAERRG